MPEYTNGPPVEATAIKAPSQVMDLLSRLHRESMEQEATLRENKDEFQQVKASINPNSDAENTEWDDLMRDKFIALDADKASFMYNLVRATGALNVVEAGTSFGVSTIYLALAVGQNARAAGKSSGDAKVIGTEFEPTKAALAKKHWVEAGDAVEPWIELREGNLLETLREDMPVIDFVLFDIWTPMVVPTLEVLEPKMRPGAVLLCDNVVSSRKGYEDFFAYVNSPNSKYKAITLPFEGGLEMLTYWPAREDV